MGDITFEQAWNFGGPLMWVLAFFSVIGLAVVLYLWYSQRRGICVPEAVSRIRAAKDPAAEGGRIADRMMASVDWLADIAAIAPLVGLLGTVLGMFRAFGGIASDVEAGTHFHGSEVRSVRAVVLAGDGDVLAAVDLRVALFNACLNDLSEGVVVIVITSEHTRIILTNLCNSIAAEDGLHIHAEIRVAIPNLLVRAFFYDYFFHFLQS